MNLHSTRSRFLAGLTILCLTFLLLGAGRVANNMKMREQAQQRTRDRVAGWHGQIAAELPSGQQAAWQQFGLLDPCLLLQACASEVPLKTYD